MNRVSMHSKRALVPNNDVQDESYQSLSNDSEPKANASMTDDDKSQIAPAPLYLFLASSLNVELVYMILTGLTKFAQLKKDENG